MRGRHIPQLLANILSMASNSILISYAATRSRSMVPIVLGAVAAALTLLPFYAPWVVALFGALIICVFAVAEKETAILLSVFLLPAAWVLRTDLPFSNIFVPARYLFVSGFFLGRLWRGDLGFRELCHHRLTRWTLVFLAAAVGSILFGSIGWTHSSARALMLLGSYVAFYFFTIAWIDTPRRLEKVVRTLFLSTIVVSLFGILQEAIDGYTSFWMYLYPRDESFIPWNKRVPSFLGYSNVLAGYLNLILPFALACCFLGPARWKTLGLWTVVLGCATLAFTQSRGALVAFSCVLVLAVLSFVKHRKKQIALLAVIFLVGVGFYTVGRLLSPVHLGGIVAREPLERLAFWATAWRLFLASPVFGIGIGNYPEVYGYYIPQALIPAHVFTANGLYFQLLSEMGIAGTASFLWLSAAGIGEGRCQFRSSSSFLSRALGFGVLGGVVATLVHGFMDLAVDVSPQFGTLFWFMLALLAANARLSQVSCREGLRSRRPPS